MSWMTKAHQPRSPSCPSQMSTCPATGRHLGQRRHDRGAIEGQGNGECEGRTTSRVFTDGLRCGLPRCVLAACCEPCAAFPAAEPVPPLAPAASRFGPPPPTDWLRLRSAFAPAVPTALPTALPTVLAAGSASAPAADDSMACSSRRASSCAHAPSEWSCDAASLGCKK